MKRITILTVLAFSLASCLTAQDTNVNRKRLNTILIGGGLSYTVSMIGLGFIWYEDLGKFHFFNDNDGWGYMDKLGHVAAAQHIGRLSMNSLAWAGVDRKKTIWYGGATGLFFLTSVEVFDGFSEDWGFSIGDVAANTLGVGAFISQELLWGEQKILLKWSYSNSPYSQYRPELLGSNGSERWLKDYNGQIYWFSANLKSLFLQNSSKTPEWLNLAIGYSINGYTGANRNPTENQSGEMIPSFRRYGQIYFSPDIDLTRIPTQSKLLKSVFTVLNFIKVPTPGLEYNPVDGWRYHWILF